MKDAIKIAIVTVTLIFCAPADADAFSSPEVRELIFNSMLEDIKRLENDEIAVTLANKLAALVRSYGESMFDCYIAYAELAGKKQGD